MLMEQWRPVGITRFLIILFSFIDYYLECKGRFNALYIGGAGSF
jgi:hypothetical protein